MAPAMRSAMRPAVRHLNQIYKQKFMKNTGAKLQAPQCPEIMAAARLADRLVYWR